jgi:phage protein D
MGSFTYNTWNPNLTFEVAYGNIDEDELRARTLSFELTDNAREFDTIEWVLDNSDGYLTQPEHVAAGLIIRVRLGYQNAQQPWRSFLINRMSGGVGVAGHGSRAGGGIPGSPVGAQESQITLYGRNRNAPDLKRKRGGRGAKGKGSKKYTHYGGGTSRGKSTRVPWQKHKFKGGSSSSITNFDLVINEKSGVAKLFKVSQTSDAVYEMAKQAGYDDEFIDIEPTEDKVNTVVVQSTESYGQWLSRTARSLGFLFKADSRGFKFIRKRSTRQLKAPTWLFSYGADDDTLEITFDTDFRLPVPHKAIATGYNPDVRTKYSDEIDEDSATVGNSSSLILSNYNYKRYGKANLTREETFLQAGGDISIKPKLIARWINRHLKAFKFKLTDVGNPKIMGGDLVDLRGTGSFLDGRWYVGSAKHTFDGSTYKTTLALEPPPRKGSSKGTIVHTRFGDPGALSGKGGNASSLTLTNVKVHKGGRKPMKSWKDQQEKNAQPGGYSQQTPEGGGVIVTSDTGSGA